MSHTSEVNGTGTNWWYIKRKANCHENLYRLSLKGVIKLLCLTDTTAYCNRSRPNDELLREPTGITQGTGATTQQADFANNPGEGVLEVVKWSLGRGGTILAGDSLNIEVAVTASNANGSSTEAVNVAINWV